MRIQKFTINSSPSSFLRIYGYENNLNHFLNTAIEPDEEIGVSNESLSVDGGNRRQYPGDPSPINVGGHTRNVLVDLDRRTGNALPGKTFSMRSFDDDGNELEFRQFTYQGSFMNLHGWLYGNVTNKTHLYNHTGGPPYILQASS